MEKAVLKTLTYSNIFDYPLKAYEIHKWLIGRKTTLRQVEIVLKRLDEKRKTKNEKGYYSLLRREGLATKRIKRAKQSLVYIRKVRIISYLLKIIPWIKLVGISGGLSMENTDKNDDIDLFLITSKRKLWITRFLILTILTLIGQRRKPNHNIKEIAGKICCNILTTEDNLEQKRKDIYTAHEVLQMKILWQRENVYSKYLLDNQWAFKFLPNWVSSERLMIKDERLKRRNHQSLILNHKSIFDRIEYLVKGFQLKIMQKPKGMERIEEGVLYFHPNDIRDKILKEYEQKVNTLINP